MKTIHLSGDLLALFREGKIDAIAHCCNCKGVMGAGIAAQIREQFPAAYEAYKACERRFGLQLGWFSAPEITRDSEDKTGLIYNLHGQDEYGGHGRHLNYEGLYRALERARDSLVAMKYTNFGVPFKMGCDRAGGDWNVVLAMLESVFRDTDIEVIIVTYSTDG